MKAFLVIRHEDITGLSGTGVVAEGVEWLDGTVTMRWMDIDHDTENYKRGVRPTTVQHENIKSVEALHGHNGATEVVWFDDEHRQFADNNGDVHHRSAVTGEFVTEDYAEKNPDTTVKETDQ